MNIFAAIDLRDGQAVQLVGGDPGDERVRIPDPAAVARRWLDAGFRHIHVVDLDAALGSGDNAEAIAAIARTVRDASDRARAPADSSAPGRADAGPGPDRGDVVLQVGGGIRDDDAVRRVLDLGADRVIVGTRAVEDPDWLRDAAPRFAERLVVAADVKGNEVVTRGWTEGTGRAAAAFVRGLDPLPLAGILVTDVSREGRQEGADADRFRALVEATRHPILAAGGITTPDDLEALAVAGVAGAVLGMALYSGRLDPAVILDRSPTQEDR